MLKSISLNKGCRNYPNNRGFKAGIISYEGKSPCQAPLHNIPEATTIAHVEEPHQFSYFNEI